MARSFRVTPQRAGVAKLEGVAELKRALEELGTEVSTRVGVTANRRAAQTFRDRLREVAPYDPREKVRRQKSGSVIDYGHLRDQIRVRRVRATKQGNIVYAVTVGRAFWGRFQELGTVNQPARPWMRPAFERLKRELIAVQISELRSGIDRAAKVAARRSGMRRPRRSAKGRNV